MRFAEHFVEAVGAEEQAVAGLDAETCAVDSERVTLSNAAGERVGILGWHEVAGTLALVFNQLLRHRVVNGQFFERSASQEVSGGVADMADEQLVADDLTDGECATRTCNRVRFESFFAHDPVDAGHQFA